jgi:hypothetical protein
MLTPPVPMASSVSFGPRVAISTRPTHAVTPAQGKVAASSSVRLAGASTRPASSSTTYSDSMPSIEPPSADETAAWKSKGPSSHF